MFDSGCLALDQPILSVSTRSEETPPPPPLVVLLLLLMLMLLPATSLEVADDAVGNSGAVGNGGAVAVSIFDTLLVLLWCACSSCLLSFSFIVVVVVAAAVVDNLSDLAHLLKRKHQRMKALEGKEETEINPAEYRYGL